MTNVSEIIKKHFTDKNYYSILPLLKCDAKYNNMLSARNEGKSFQVKHYCLLDALMNGHKFVYIRRYSVETKIAMVNSYFEDIDFAKVSKVTGISIEGIEVRAGVLYAYKWDDNTGKKFDVMQIGRVINLAAAGHVKSNSFANYVNIVYEEYVTEQGYLFDEPRKLQDLVSTVLRDRDGKVFLIGNILVRLNPYLRDWNITDFKKIAVGEIRTYDMEGVRVAIEHCSNTASKRNTGMFFGKAKENIVGGEYVTREYPHIPKPFKEYECRYKLNLVCENMAYTICILMEDKNIPFVFIYPTDKPKEKRQVRADAEHCIMQTPLFDIRTRGDDLLSILLKQNLIRYADNLTGTEFNMIRGKYKM